MADAADLVAVAPNREPYDVVHLSVAVLFDDVNAFHTLDPAANLVAERDGLNAQVGGFDVLLLAQLIAGFHDGPVARSVSDDTDLGPLHIIDDGRGKALPRGFVFPRG